MSVLADNFKENLNRVVGSGLRLSVASNSISNSTNVYINVEETTDEDSLLAALKANSLSPLPISNTLFIPPSIEENEQGEYGVHSDTNCTPPPPQHQQSMIASLMKSMIRCSTRSSRTVDRITHTLKLPSSDISSPIKLPRDLGLNEKCVNTVRESFFKLDSTFEAEFQADTLEAKVLESILPVNHTQYSGHEAIALPDSFISDDNPFEKKVHFASQDQFISQSTVVLEGEPSKVATANFISPSEILKAIDDGALEKKYVKQLGRTGNSIAIVSTPQLKAVSLNKMKQVVSSTPIRSMNNQKSVIKVIKPKRSEQKKKADADEDNIKSPTSQRRNGIDARMSFHVNDLVLLKWKHDLYLVGKLESKPSSTRELWSCKYLFQNKLSMPHSVPTSHLLPLKALVPGCEIGVVESKSKQKYTTAKLRGFEGEFARIAHPKLPSLVKLKTIAIHRNLYQEMIREAISQTISLTSCIQTEKSMAIQVIKVVLSGTAEKKSVKDLISKRKNLELVNEVREADVLISEGKRTAKHLHALILGLPIHQLSWLEMTPKLKPKSSISPYLEGHRIMLLGDAKFQKDWLPLLESLGGQITEKKPSLVIRQSEKYQLRANYQQEWKECMVLLAFVLAEMILIKVVSDWMPFAEMQAKSSTSNAAELAFLSFLQSEYLVLSNESRRKYPEIRQSLEGVFSELKRITAILNESPLVISVLPEIGQGDIFLKPLVMSVDKNVPKLLSVVGNIVQRMCINYECLPVGYLEDVLDILETMAVNGTEELQLKSLQSMMPLVTGLLDTLHGKRLQHAYWIVFKLLESKHSMIRNTALAVLRQLVIVLFEKISKDEFSYRVIASEDDWRSLNSPAPHSHVEDALLIFDDICSSYNDEPTKVFVGLQALNKLHALELIESILGNVPVFLKYPQFILLVREKVCTMLVKRIDSSEFPESARLWRIANSILHNYYEGMRIEAEIFVSFAIRILDDPEGALWRKVLAAEVLSELLKDKLLVDSFYSLAREQDNPISLVDILECVRRFVNNDLTGASTMMMIEFETSQVKVPCLSQFDKASPPTIPKNHLAVLGYQCVRGLLETCSNKGILERTWNVVLVVLELIFSSNVDLAWREHLIATFESLLYFCAQFELKEGITAVFEQEMFFIKKGSINDYSCLLLCKSVLEAAIRVPHFLGSTWVYVFRMVHWFDAYTLSKSKKLTTLPVTPTVVGSRSRIAAFLSPSTSSANIATMEDPGKDMIGDVTDLLRQLLEIDVDDCTFLEMLKAVSTVIHESFQNDPTLCMHPIQKLRQLVMRNCHRLDTCGDIWPFLSDCVLQLLQVGDVNLRAMGMDILALVMQQVVTIPSSDQIQVQVMNTMLTGVENGNVDVQQASLDCLSKVVTSHGEVLQSGWDPLLLILTHTLKALGVDDLDLSMLKATFAILASIAEDYRRSFKGQTLQLYIDALGQCAMSKLELNISLTAVGFLWDVADHILLQASEGSNYLWLRVLDTFYRLADDLRPELRNSVVTSLFRTVAEVKHSTLGEWQHLYEKILNPLLEGLYVAAGEEKWDETLMLALAGSVKVLRTKIVILKSFGEFFEQVVWQRSFLDVVERHCRTGSASLINAALSESIVTIPQVIVNGNGSLQKRLMKVLKTVSGGIETWEQVNLTKLMRVYGVVPLKDLGVFQQWLLATGNALIVPYAEHDRGNDKDLLNELQKAALQIVTSAETLNSEEDREVVKLAWSLLACRILSHRIGEVRDVVVESGPTLIAFSYELLRELPGWLKGSVMWVEHFEEIIGTLGKWMAAKFSAPSGKLGPAWIPAYHSFVAIMQNTDFRMLSPQDINVLNSVIEGTLESIHYISGRVDNEEEEKSDLEFVKCLEDCIIPSCGEKGVAETVFVNLVNVSRFLYCTGKGTDYLHDIRAREKPALAQAALQAIVHLAPTLPIAQKSLVHRTRHLLTSYLKARSIYAGRVNLLPSVCAEEVHHTLVLIGKNDRVWGRVGWCVMGELIELVALEGDLKIVRQAQKVLKELTRVNTLEMTNQLGVSYDKRDSFDYFPTTHFNSSNQHNLANEISEMEGLTLKDA